jgi:hypothetical protein
VVQFYDETVKVLQTIKLENSDIYKLCTTIQALYPNYLYMVTGDATGKNSSGLVKDNINYYTVIREKLALSNGQMKVPAVNPRLENNQVLVNSVLANMSVEIHEQHAAALHYDLRNVKTNSDGTIVKNNRQDATQQADALDTFRYFCNVVLINHLKQL